MIGTNTNWNTANAQMGKWPIYVFAIGGQATVYTTRDLAAAGITGTLPAYHPWLLTPQGASQSIDVINGKSTIGEMVLEVVDQLGVVRTLVGSTTLEGQTATLSVGYPGLAWSEFVVLHTCLLYKLTPTNGYTSWNFTARDMQVGLTKSVYLHPENGDLLSTDNPWYVGGTPGEVALAVLLFGMELAATAVDQAAFALLDSPVQGLHVATRPFLFVLTEAFSGLQFLEAEVYRASGLYPVITPAGQISVRSSRAPAAGAAAAFAFTADNMCILPEFDRMPVINEVICRFDYDGSNYGREMYFLNSDSLGTFGRTQQFVLESKGLRTELGASGYSSWLAGRMFGRFAGTTLRGGAPTLQIEAFLMTLPVWVGDYVTVSHPLMPDLMTGALGVTNRVYEVIDREPDYANGRMKYSLLDTGLTGMPTAYQWDGSGVARPFVIGTSLIY